MNASLEKFKDSLKQFKDEIERIKDELSSQASALEEEIASDKKTLVAKQRRLKRIAGAHSVLTGSSPRGGAKPERKCVTKDLVIQLVEGFLADNGELSRDDLEGLTKSKVRELGYSLSGFALRMNEATKMPQFSLTADGHVRLTPQPDSPTNGVEPTTGAAPCDASAVPGNVPPP